MAEPTAFILVTRCLPSRSLWDPQPPCPSPSSRSASISLWGFPPLSKFLRFGWQSLSACPSAALGTGPSSGAKPLTPQRECPTESQGGTQPRGVPPRLPSSFLFCLVSWAPWGCPPRPGLAHQGFLAGVSVTSQALSVMPGACPSPGQGGGSRGRW